MSTTDRPSTYQLGILRNAGCRIRPRSYASAQERIARFPPSPNQVALLQQIGLDVPATRTAASDVLTAYEHAHPEWAAARRAERSAKGQATRRARAAEGVSPQYNETLEAYHKAAVERHGPHAASKPALNFLRSLALKLPRDSASRIDLFSAMREGLSATDAGNGIDALKAGPASLTGPA